MFRRNVLFFRKISIWTDFRSGDLKKTRLVIEYFMIEKFNQMLEPDEAVK